MIKRDSDDRKKEYRFLNALMWCSLVMTIAIPAGVALLNHFLNAGEWIGYLADSLGAISFLFFAYFTLKIRLWGSDG